MAQYGMRVALAGGVFFLFQIWENVRGQRSVEKYLQEQQHPGTFSYYDVSNYIVVLIMVMEGEIYGDEEEEELYTLIRGIISMNMYAIMIVNKQLQH